MNERPRNWIWTVCSGTCDLSLWSPTLEGEGRTITVTPDLTVDLYRPHTVPDPRGEVLYKGSICPETRVHRSRAQCVRFYYLRTLFVSEELRDPFGAPPWSPTRQTWVTVKTSVHGGEGSEDPSIEMDLSRDLLFESTFLPHSFLSTTKSRSGQKFYPGTTGPTRVQISPFIIAQYHYPEISIRVVARLTICIQ